MPKMFLSPSFEREKGWTCQTGSTNVLKIGMNQKTFCLMAFRTFKYRFIKRFTECRIFPNGPGLFRSKSCGGYGLKRLESSSWWHHTFIKFIRFSSSFEQTSPTKNKKQTRERVCGGLKVGLREEDNWSEVHPRFRLAAHDFLSAWVCFDEDEALPAVTGWKDGGR